MSFRIKEEFIERNSMIKTLKLQILFTFVLMLTLAVTASAQSGLAKPEARIPAGFISPGESQYLLVVEKSSQRFFIYEYLDGEYFIRRTFPISTGENEGDKMREGDVKTPEGFYLFTLKHLKRELADIYGVLAFPMDYPNFWDKRLGKNGNGIWIHGTNRVLIPRDSNGCVALKNIDIMELESLISLNKTPILIYHDIEYRDVKELKEEASDINDFVNDWRKSWESKDFNRYRSYYHEDFTSNDGKNFTSWMNHKSRLNKKYKRLKIQLKDVRIFKHQNIIVVLFNQYYQGGLFKSNGQKRLYIKDEPEGFRIISEVWKPFPPTPPKKFLPLSVKNKVIEEVRLASLRKPAQEKKENLKVISEQENVRKLVESWLSDWKRKDLNNFMTHYHSDFRYGDMGTTDFKEYKNKMFAKHNQIDINVRKLKVDINRTKAKVTFIQDFRSTTYHDRGLKKLFLVKEGKDWRIKKESWQRIE